MKEYVLVSACLLGINCKYNGQNNYNKKVEAIIKNYNIIPICPEIYGGLNTPRIPSERRKDKVMNMNNEDVTEYFTKGAIETLKLAKMFNVKKAFLKAKSPSCGAGLIYDGTFTNSLVEGYGITAELLKENNIEIISI